MTVVGGMVIGKELSKTLVQINAQMEEILEEAKRTGVPPVKMRDSSGNYIWTPLLVAKAQTLHALVLVNQRR